MHCDIIAIVNSPMLTCHDEEAWSLRLILRGVLFWSQMLHDAAQIHWVISPQLDKHEIDSAAVILIKHRDSEVVNFCNQEPTEPVFDAKLGVWRCKLIP